MLTRHTFGGQHWHSHSYVEDDAGPTTRAGGAALGVTRGLVYPDGFSAENDGGLKVVPGAHLWRMTTLGDGLYTRSSA
jgi:hypothetical protein